MGRSERSERRGWGEQRPSLQSALIQILFICTGNICRSPMAEALMRARLAERGVDAVVASTGLVAEGRPASPEGIKVMERAGYDVRGHRSRVVSAEAVRQADLVMGLERQHVREAVVLDRGALGRAFTLKELVRRGEAVGRRRADEPLEQWLERVGAERTPADLVGWSDVDDVADPYGRSVDDYEDTRRELAGLIDRLVDLAWPAAGERTA